MPCGVNKSGKITIPAGLPATAGHCGCCPARAAGRLPGAGHGVRGVPPLHPLHPRTPLCAETRNLSLESGRTPSAACRMGHRREPSPACGRGDVRACCGAPSALRASGIAFAPAPSLHQEQGTEGVTLPEVCHSGKITGVTLPGGNRRRTADKGGLGRRGIFVFFAFCLRGTVERGRASAFPRRVILLNKARLGKGGGLGEGNPFARQRKGFPSPSAPTGSP